MRRHLVPFLLPGLLGAALFGSASVLHRQERNRALELWSLAMDVEADSLAHSYSETFRRMYEGLRTIARLPSVRRLRRGGALDADAHQTAQEIYNNLAHQVTMSEVYVVPGDFDPDAIDPDTGAPQEPLLAFDNLIVGRTLASAPGDETAADQDRGDRTDSEHQADSESDDAPEVELYEYRQMRAQLARLRQICPDDHLVAGLEYPVLCSSQVVTCDNRFFAPDRPDDAMRSGLVYSVPRFGADGRLAGCVSGIVLSRVLRQMLPSGNYALSSRGHGFVAPALQQGVWQEHMEDILAGSPARDLPYSRVLQLRIPDESSTWQLWVGRRNEEFDHSPYAQKADAIFFGVCSAILALVLGLTFAARTIARQRRLDRIRTRELEQARDAAVALARAKSNFVAVASHEIRTPMNGVLGMTELLLQSDLPPAERELAETARQSAGVLVDLIQGILDYSRIEADKIELEHVAFDPLLAIEDVVTLLAPVAAQKHLPLRLHFDGDLPRCVVGDPGRLRQIATNLIGNAIKFTERGHIAVHIASNGTAAQPSLEFAIVDTGIGLDPTLKDRLFQPFAQADSSTTRRFGGSGLGLAICRGLVTAMGGSIDYRPTQGAGTTFVFTLPFAAAAQRETTATAPLRGKRAMLISDDAEDRSSLEKALRLLGAEVLVHATVAAAAAALVGDPAAPIDVLLTASPDADAKAEQQLFATQSRPPALVRIERWTAARTSGTRTASRAVVRLPARLNQLAAAFTAATTPAVAPYQPPTLRPRAAGRALIADDNEINLRVACLIMQKLGYECVAARDGEQAVELAASEDFAVVLMDWQMPNLDGIAAATRIRADERQRQKTPVPIVAVTANALPDDERRCLEAGMNAFLTKPISGERLAVALNALRSLSDEAQGLTPLR